MVLGMRALDVPVKAYEPISGSSLNNTFRTLSKFALLERNDDELFSSNFDEEEAFSNDNIEILRIHSVVQGFFVDSLRGEGALSVWLHRATALFCQSYSIASQRIKRMHRRGYVSDYRVYEIHGMKLLDHYKKMPKGEDLETHAKTIEWRFTLERTLNGIGDEIERRTRDETAEDAFLTSIFDRTTSASDSGPATPTSRSPTGWGIYPETRADSPSDIDSIASIEDDIFSTAGSLSTNSTVSSIQFTVRVFPAPFIL